MGRRFLLRPDPELNRLFVYCLARAADQHGIEVHALGVMSNHYHMVVTDVRCVLSDFMMSLNRSLAMCIKQLRDWDEVVWEPNVSYSAVELGGPSEILDKVAYTLLNPVSAGLVRRPERWRGVLSTLEQLRGETLIAERPRVWFKEKAPKRVTLRWIVPPGFQTKGGYLGALQALVAGRLTELRTAFRRRGRSYLGETQDRKTRVSDRPKTKKHRFGRNPTFSAQTRKAWLDAMKRLRAFRRAYRAAYAAWCSGDRDTEFPVGSWWVVRHAGATAVT
jgi:putative transposase